MGLVGFSTGALHKMRLGLGSELEAFLSLGADCVELCYLKPEQIYGKRIKGTERMYLGCFQQVSVHAPSVDVRYHADEPFLGILDEYAAAVKAECIVFHPDRVDDFEVLQNLRTPAIIENMDARKDVGTNPEYFRRLSERFPFNYCLDIQHCLTLDPTLALVDEMVEAMGDRLAHIHFSGYDPDKNHVLATQTTEKVALLEKLRGLTQPIILEGTVEGSRLKARPILLQDEIDEEFTRLHKDSDATTKLLARELNAARAFSG